MKKIIPISVLLLGVILMTSCSNQENILEENGKINHVTKDNTIEEVINIPKFKEFKNFIFPLDYNNDTNLTLDNIGSLLPYHNYINTNTTLEVINYMIDEANNNNQIFYNIYTDEEKEEDSTLNNTGLFYFKGKENMPFAIICAGGGFSYVGSIHEAYPHALELSKMGYNAFVLQYRPDWEESNFDLARAISYIMKNSENLEVNKEDYSLWGSSAGARMVANIGTYGVEYFQGDNIQKPSTIVMAYTGHSDYGSDEPPTFALVGENDGIANPSVMEKRILNLQKQGVDTEFHKYPDLSHGFGLGINTSAEGWLNDAISFWEKHIT